MGRDSILSRLMPRSAKAARLRHSAPGTSFSPKTSVVLAGSAGAGAARRLTTKKRGKIVRGVLNAGDEDLQPVRGGRARSGDSPPVACAASGQLFDRAGRIIRRYGLSTGQRVDEANTLGQGRRLRRDVADVR